MNAKPKPMPASPKRGMPGDADAKAKQGMHEKPQPGAKAWLKRQGMGC